MLLDRLEDILQKCSHNSMILTDHIFQGPINQVIRIAKTAIENLKNKGGIKRVPSGISPIRHDGVAL